LNFTVGEYLPQEDKATLCWHKYSLLDSSICSGFREQMPGQISDLGSAAE